jgi:hypothetical protein
MSWDPNKSIDEQPNRFWRAAPMLFVALVLIACIAWAVFG